MTKRIVRLALVAAAAAAFAAPAAPAQASCHGTFVLFCVRDLVSSEPVCVPVGSEYEVCVP